MSTNCGKNLKSQTAMRIKLGICRLLGKLIEIENLISRRTFLSVSLSRGLRNNQSAQFRRRDYDSLNVGFLEIANTLKSCMTRIIYCSATLDCMQNTTFAYVFHALKYQQNLAKNLAKHSTKVEYCTKIVTGYCTRRIKHQ